MTLTKWSVLNIVVIAICLISSYFQLVTSSMEFSLTHGEPMIKNDQNYVNLDNLRVRKVNRTHHLIIGNMTTYVSYGNDFEFFALLYKKQGNDYKKTPYKIGPKKFCDFIRDEKMFYPSILATTDLPSPETCPWPIRVYQYFGYCVQLDVFPSTLSSGDYMITVHSELKGKLLNGYRFYGTLSNSLDL